MAGEVAFGILYGDVAFVSLVAREAEGDVELLTFGPVEKLFRSVSPFESKGRGEQSLGMRTSHTE